MLRRRFIIDKIQLKYLGLVLFSMVAPLLAMGYCLYYALWVMLQYAATIPPSQAKSIYTILLEIKSIVTVSIPLIILIFSLYALRISHQLAGPLQRLQREITDIIKTKEYGRRLKVRKGDDLYELVKRINLLVETLEAQAKNRGQR